jgi:Cys-tRNA(Pro)/Cys-tRNA(Cys) deacylase
MLTSLRIDDSEGDLAQTTEVPYTRIMALLDAAAIRYRLLPHSAPALTVEDAARTRGVRMEEMLKSILLKDREGRFVMACVPGSARVTPAAVRALLPANWKRLQFASGDEILGITGCPQGAVSPIGLPPEVPVVFDESLTRNVRVNLSSGDPMLGLEMDMVDLLRLVPGMIGKVSSGGQD